MREVIGRRLDRLSERCNESLTIASVVGREFSLEQLSPLIEDISADRLLEVLDEALSARVIEELPQSVGQYRFTHALIQETLADELSATRRVRLHARIAIALEGLYGPDADGHSAELARHFQEAQTVMGTERLVHYSLLAGERALAAYAYEDASFHFQRGLAAKEDGPPDVESGKLLFGLGRAQVATLPTYDLRGAVETLERAFQLLLDAGEVASAVAVAEVPLPPTAGYITGMGELIYKGVDLVEPDSRQAARLLASYARAAGLEEGDYHSAEQALDRALEIALREGDQALELWIRSYACDVEGYHCQPEKCYETCLNGLLLTEKVDDPRSELLVNSWAIGWEIFWGRREETPKRISAAMAAANRLRDHFYLSRELYMSLVFAQVTGDWGGVRDASDQGLAVSPLEFRLILGKCLMESQLGDFDAARESLERMQEVLRHVAPGPTYAHAVLAALAPVLSRVWGTDTGLDIADQAAQIVLTSPSRTPFAETYTRVGASLNAVRRVDPSAAKEQYEALAGTPGIEIVIMAGIHCHRLLGLLAQTMGESNKAVEHFEDALAFCREAGYRPELAWTCCDYADLLLESNNGEGRTKATALLDESLAISGELGMRPLMERVLSRREILKA